ncbi:helix-turn-helix domain-containing protein (plasmid) [Streptomyces mirabilis]|uniref:helix-turn-helix domain-containing protein n=1 Tax=Streptomyces mirabilis TaxID=68239 RepID=UPI001BB06CAA|nr:helix-turn-helix domain-containing protein [Streptomyces mirabilis]QUW85553.1 helix-turn-helix domain-containing protein [Streptomyces mirabilis]
MKKFKPRPGFTVLAHKVALDPNATTNRHLHSHAGAARPAYNWAVAYITAVWWQRKAEKSYGILEEQLTEWRSWSLPSLRRCRAGSVCGQTRRSQAQPADRTAGLRAAGHRGRPRRVPPRRA